MQDKLLQLIPLDPRGRVMFDFEKDDMRDELELLEAEKDIIEQIAIAQKPEEKQLLQKQLDQLREMRRQLDKSLR